MACAALSVAKGAAQTVRVRVKTPSGARVDLTGLSLVLTVKTSADDALSPVLEKDTSVPGEGDLVDPTNGLCEFYILSTDTAALDVAAYTYDVWLVDGAVHHQVVPPSVFSVTSRVGEIP